MAQIDPSSGQKEAHDGDGQLLMRHIHGDKEAFATLMRAHSCAIYGYLTRCGVEPAERDDLFQDVFHSVHKAAASFDLQRPFKPWLFTIVVNAVRSHFRKKARRVVQLSANGQSMDDRSADHRPDERAAEPHPDEVVEEVVEARQTARWLEKEIERLPMMQREVVLLCCVERLPRKEVAATLEMPVNTVKTHLRRARIAMAHALVKRNQPIGVAR